MAVGYAVLSQALNINGTANLTGEWKVYIDSITEITEGNTTSGKSIAAEVTGAEKTDAYFEESDGIVLIDYKTDRVKTAEELIARYKKQLELYGEALEQTTGKKVKERIMYSFCLGKEISV